VRCSHAFDRCSEENPSLFQVNRNHHVACRWDVYEKRPRNE
jgi:ABC-type dipeptide/oligopeptide/nickel transport system ATPase component